MVIEVIIKFFRLLYVLYSLEENEIYSFESEEVCDEVKIILEIFEFYELSLLIVLVFLMCFVIDDGVL